MSLEDFTKLWKEETTYYEILCYALPTIIFLVVLVGLAFSSGSIDAWIFFIPFIYPGIFFLVYERKYFKRKNASAENYFKVLNYDRATIRYYFIGKIFRNFAIFLVIMAFLVTGGIESILKTTNENLISYNSSVIKYNSDLNKILEMNQDDLRNYYKNATATFTQYGVEQTLLTIVTNEIKQNFTNSNSANLQLITNLESDKIKNMDELHQRELLLQKIDKMSSDDLRQLVISDLQNAKPNPYFFNINNDNSKVIGELFLFVYIPGLMVYSVILTRYSLISKKDFHFHCAMGYFSIVSKYANLSDMEKRKYIKFGILHYDKFINKNLNLHINNLDAIYSRLLVNNPETLIGLSQEMSDALDKDNHLKLLHVLKKTPQNDNSEILVQTSYLNKLKEGSGLIIPIVSTISAIISILTKFT